jgi:hypothetical protein
MFNNTSAMFPIVHEQSTYQQTTDWVRMKRHDQAGHRAGQLDDSAVLLWKVLPVQSRALAKGIDPS